jgi:hypothetical protein
VTENRTHYGGGPRWNPWCCSFARFSVFLLFKVLFFLRLGIFGYSDSRIDFSGKVGLLISRFSFPTPVQVPSQIYSLNNPIAGWAVTFAWRERFWRPLRNRRRRRRRRRTKRRRRRRPHLTSHHSDSCRSLHSNAPPRYQHTSPAKTSKPGRVGVHRYDVLAAEFGVHQSPRLSAASAAASPDVARVTVHHSPRLSTAAAASGKGSNLASSPRESIMGGIL